MPTPDPRIEAEELSKLVDQQAAISAPRPRGAGGTPGGVGTFVGGLLLSVLGGYFVLNQVQVTSSFTFFGLWGWNRPAGFGLTMLPMLIGVGVLFFDGKSKLGWILTAGGALTIVAAVLMSLSIHWEATSLFNTLLMFGMLAAGIGLVARSLRPYPE